MLEEIGVRALRAVEQVFGRVGLGVRGAGVGVWVGDFGGSAVAADVDAVPEGDEGGERGGGEDVAAFRECG